MCQISLWRGEGRLWWWHWMWRITCLWTHELREQFNHRLLHTHMQKWLRLPESRMQHWCSTMSTRFLQHWLVQVQPGFAMQERGGRLWSTWGLWRRICVWRWQLCQRTNIFGLLYRYVNNYTSGITDHIGAAWCKSPQKFVIRPFVILITWKWLNWANKCIMTISFRLYKLLNSSYCISYIDICLSLTD